MFFDPSFLVMAQASEKVPVVEVQRERDPERAQRNAPLPPPPDKTTAPRDVDEAGSPGPVDPARAPSAMTDIPLEALPEQEVDDEEPGAGVSERARENEPPEPSSPGTSRSPWGAGASGVR